MRSEWLLVLLVSCAPPLSGKCEPVSASWATPVYHCDTGSGAVPAITPDAAVATTPPPKGSGDNGIEMLPSKATVKGDAIVLTDEVEFGADGSVADGSTPILDDLGATMADHPEVQKIEITVHAKKKADADKRAAAMKKYLVDHKTAADRITTKGATGKDAVDIKITKRKKS